jgi:MFS family permease
MILTLLVAPIRADLGISDTQMSLLVGTAFALFYTVMGIPIAYLADRGNRRRLIAGGIALWSVMTALCGFAPNYPMLFLARVGVGIGEATLSPSAYSLMSDLFPRDRLGRAVAVYSIGVPLGSGIALALGGLIVETASGLSASGLALVEGMAPWRLVFIIVALPGIAIALLMLSVREPARRGGLGRSSQRSASNAFAFVWRGRSTFLPHFFGLALLTLVIYGNMAWIPTFLDRTYGMKPASGGFYFGIILAITGAAGLLIGGAIADRWFRSTTDGHLRTILVAVVGAAPFLIAGPQMPTAELALACIAAAMLIASMHGGVAGAALQIVTPNPLRAQITAFYFFIANLIGFGLGPTAVALITDYGFGNDGAVRHSLSIVAAVALPISAILLLAGLAPFRRSVAEIESADNVASGAAAP